MAPRAYWKGYLKLSLVLAPSRCSRRPVSERRSASTSFTSRPATGSSIAKLTPRLARSRDADIIKGYEVGKGEYLEIEPEELEAIAIESKRTIEIDEFVPRKRSTNSTSTIRTTSCRTARSASKPLRLSAKPFARKVWSRLARSSSHLASISSR